MTKQDYLNQEKQPFEIASGENRLHLWQTKLPAQFSDEETSALLKEYKKTQSKQILQRVVEGNLRALVDLCQSAFEKFDEDAFQEASVVLLDAAKSFNPQRNQKFSAFLKQKFCKFQAKQTQQKDLCQILNISDFLAHKSIDCNEDVFSDNGQRAENVHLALDVDYIFNVILPQQFSKKHANLFKAYYIEKKPLQEIGEEFGITRQAVLQVLQRIRCKVVNLYVNGFHAPVFKTSIVARNGQRFCAQQINQALQGFSLRDQKIFWEYYQNHKSLQKIGQEYNLKEHTVDGLVAKMYLALTNQRRGAAKVVVPKQAEKQKKHVLAADCAKDLNFGAKGNCNTNGSPEEDLTKEIRKEIKKEYSFEQLKGYLGLFDKTEQKIFVDYYVKNKTQEQIAQELSIAKDTVYRQLKFMRGQLVLIKQLGFEKAMQKIGRQTIVRAILRQKAGHNLSVVDVKHFVEKLSPKERQTFVQYLSKPQFDASDASSSNKNDGKTTN